MMESAPPERETVVDGLVLLVALLFPTLVTWVYFVALAGSEPSLQQAAYGLGKFLQFSLPVAAVWLGWVRLKPFGARRSPLVEVATKSDDTTARGSRGENSALDWGLAIGFGVAVGSLIFALYYGYLIESELGDRLATTAREKIQRFGITQAWQFAALGIFYSLGHSGLEEYYWRWFVFRGLAGRRATWLAILISSAGFMAHHVLLLATFLGWSEPLMWLASIGVAIGGAFWAWLYARTKRLRYPWLSHLLVDAAIFGLGYQIWTSGG